MSGEALCVYVYVLYGFVVGKVQKSTLCCAHTWLWVIVAGCEKKRCQLKLL